MKRVLSTGVVFLAGVLKAVAGADGPAVIETSYIAPDGLRVLQHEVVVNASPEAVWRAFTTAEGLMEWAVPSAWVDFRLGGSWETSYDPSARQGDPANIRTRILSYQPMCMISVQAVHAPPGFEHPEVLEKLFSVFSFEEVEEGRTRIQAAGIGYGEGDAFDQVYEFFRAGNAWTLDQLRQRFETGPVNWRERLQRLSGGTSADRGNDEDRLAAP